MATPIAFESAWEKEASKKELRKAREHILAKAKTDYERQERKKELAKQRGEDTWMLQSVNDRISQEEKEIKKAKHKKHKKEKKKHKKEKKKKVKKNETSEDSASDSDEDMQWVEKSSAQPETSSKTEPVVQGPTLQRDDWMSAPPSYFPCISRDEIRDKKKKEKEKEDEVKRLMEQPGMHERELNPYWKDGGKGLPEEDPAKKKNAAASGMLSTGDCGVGWWRKALLRCEEQAKEEGRTLEEVAADRYGSLEKLQSMLNEAEEALQIKQFGSRPGSENWRRKDFASSSKRKYGDITKDEMSNSERTTDRDGEKEGRWGRHRSRERSEHSRERNRSRERSRDRERDSKQEGNRSRDRSEEKYRRRSRERDRNHDRDQRRDSDRYSNRSRRTRSRSRERDLDSRGKSKSAGNKYKSLSSRFMKPGDNDSYSRYRASDERDDKSSAGWKKKGFVKPGEDKETTSSHDQSEDSYMSPKKSSKFMKPDERASSTYDKKYHSYKNEQSSSVPAWKKEVKDSKERSPIRKSRDSETESSSSSGSASESEEEPAASRSSPPVEILTEQQMNQLGAKILKAELMGNEELAAKLKAQIEAARKAKESQPSVPISSSRPSGDKKQGADTEEDMTVVLTRTGRSGLAIPVPASQHEAETGKRRKKKKVATHGKDGKRDRYFDDDDKFDLKKLVEREKMSTAEDQNMMFSRLAGRAVEKTNEDYQVDDVFLSRAAGQQSEAQQEQKDRSQAIFEHRKMTKALDKCPFCFENTPKHLIVAIGIKVYLCLPNHKSLTDGHCLIVPIQHVSSGTSVDEDVWSEIQVFRKGLTRMFEKLDEDTVFMETVMNLKYHPHMVLECVPMPREIGELSPIYFKKAILDSGSEWAQNKKLVDLSQKDVRKSVPKGFPYFAVDFGLQGGFAHVIEDEKTFPRYFGREIVGGMMDLGPEYWRKPHKENFDDQRKKVLKFADWWKPYDWTQRLQKNDD